MIIMSLIPKKAGIYKLTCNTNGKIYVGKAINLYKRLIQHKCRVNKIKVTWFFENAIIKYGWDSFDVEILEVMEPFDKLRDNTSLLERESYYIEKYDSTNKQHGYNIQKHTGEDGTGNPKKPITEEHRANLKKSRALQVRGPLSEEHKQKLRGPKSPESIEKMRQTKKGSKLSEEHKEKIRQSCMGNTHTEETKEKCRQAKLGIPRSPETIEKMRQAKLGKSQPREQVEKRKQTILNNKKLKNKE